MWKCPKCEREFKNPNQNHFCGEKPKTIDEYIGGSPEEICPILTKVRETIRAAAPEATEKISWQMPTFWQKENLIHFATFKKHLGIYPGDLSLAPFMDRLEGYHTTKGAIQFPYDKPIDYDLIADITRWRVSCVEEVDRRESEKKSKGESNQMKKPRAYTMTFASVYPMYIEKAEKKGRTKAEVDEIIFWLTGYDEASLAAQIDSNVDFETFFDTAPQINPSASLITGVICGHRVENIEDKMMQNIRWLDKLIDELAKGKSMDKILRK